MKVEVVYDDSGHRYHIDIEAGSVRINQNGNSVSVQFKGPGKLKGHFSSMTYDDAKRLAHALLLACSNVAPIEFPLGGSTEAGFKPKVAPKH